MTHVRKAPLRPKRPNIVRKRIGPRLEPNPKAKPSAKVERLLATLAVRILLSRRKNRA